MSRDSDAAFDAFMGQHQKDLEKFAYVLTTQWHDAYDLVQEAAARIYARHWAGQLVNSPDTAVKAYFRVSIHNLWLNQKRDRRREFLVDDFTYYDHNDARRLDQDVVDRDEGLKRLMALPSRQRAIIFLRYYEDLSIRDVADCLGIDEGTVKSASSRALSALERQVAKRRRLGEEGE